MRTMIQRGDLGAIYMVHGGFWQDWLLLDTDYNWRVEAAERRRAPRRGRPWLALDRPGAVHHRATGHTRCWPIWPPSCPIRQKPERALDTFTTRDEPQNAQNNMTQKVAWGNVPGCVLGSPVVVFSTRRGKDTEAMAGRMR